MDDAFSSSMAAGLAAAAAAVSERAGASVEMALDGAAALGQDAVALFRFGAIAVTTRLAGDPATEVGVVFSEEAVFSLTALILKLGVFPEEMGEDVEIAIGELMSAFIGGWNEAQRLPRMSWEGSAAARRVDALDQVGLTRRLTEQPTGLVGGTLTLGATVYPFAVFGSLGWMPAATRVIAVPAEAPRPAVVATPPRALPPSAAPPREVGSPPPPIAVSGPPAPRAFDDDGPLDVAFPTPPPPPFQSSTAHAASRDEPLGRASALPASSRVMIVDATGALSAWLSRQLESRAVALYHADPALLRESGGATVLIVEADAALLAHFAPQQTVVMRRG